MKKKIFFAALACVALASCVSESENLPQENKGQQLSFSAPVMHNQTRHVGEIEPGQPYPADESFTVFGIEHNGDFAGWNANNVIKNADGSDFFPAAGEVVSNPEQKGSHWFTTSKDYYLPTEPNYKLTFAAYSPFRAKNDAESVSYGADGLVVTDWRMPNESHYDLMFSKQSTNNKQADIHIAFMHALSSIHVAFAKPQVNGPASVVVQKVAVKGTAIKNVGTFKDRITAAADGTAAVWENLSEDNLPAEYTIFAGDDFEVPTSTATEPATANKRYFMPIPQNLTADIKLILSYKIKMKAGDDYEEVKNLEIPFLDFLISEGQKTTAWTKGTRYFYNITFGALTKIQFHPEVSDWSTVQNAGTYVIK